MTNQDYDNLRQSVENWQDKKKSYDFTRNYVFGMRRTTYLIIFGILFIYVFSKKDTTSENTTGEKRKNNPTEKSNSNSSEIGNIATNSKYQSHNYYNNNVTEYLETKADGSVFYSTSTRPNPIKMLVTSGDNPNEFVLTFPSGAGDNQKYKMTKSDENIIITPPNGKKQIYTLIKASANTNHGWKTFKHKYGFSIELPDYFSEGILTNDATQSYTDELIEDAMNKSNITVETIGEGSQTSLAATYQSTLTSSENVVYKVLQNNWFVITGQDVNGIYYLKTMIKNGQTHYLSVRYPVSQKERFDKILPRIANSFQ